MAALLVTCAAPRAADACASIVPAGFQVRIAGEEALIVWDPVHRIEHFIRRGDFETTAPSFGFLVPTPSAPTLAAANEGAFPRLTEALRPAVRRHRTWSIGPPLCLGTFLMRGARTATSRAVSPVRVLSETRVAGYDTAVLEADDANALTDWLLAHGYPYGPVIARWLAPYVADRWKVTAFKVAKGATSGDRLGLQAVRLTFATDAPFYPYREPEDARESPGRTLRVFLVTPGRMEGVLGEERTPWNATLEYSRPLRDAVRLLEGALPASLIPQGSWLSSFRDTVTRRPPADLFFRKTEDQHEVIPPPTVLPDEVEVPFPAELLAILFGVLWWRRRRRRKAALRG